MPPSQAPPQEGEKQGRISSTPLTSLLLAVVALTVYPARVTKWAGIVRVSHMGARRSDDTSFHSERDQIKAMEEAVKKAGGSLELLPSELDVSGGLPLEKRPSLKQAVEGVEAGTYGGIVVAYQSRLGRDVEQEEAVWRRVEKAGGQILMALDWIDTASVDGRTFRRIRSAMNAGVREKHVEDFDRLRAKCVEAGIWMARQTPRGYNKGTDKRLHPNRDRQAVAKAFRDRGAGVSVSQIARDLGMTTSGVRQLLANRVYLGELKVGRYVNPAAHEPIVDPDTWHAAQRSQPRPGRKGPPALGAGVVRCAGCGHVMSRTGPEKTRHYSCHRNHSGGRCPQPASIQSGRLDRYLDAYGRLMLQGLEAESSDTGRAEELRLALTNAERELQAFLSGVEASGVDSGVWGATLSEKAAAVEACRENLDRELALRRLPAKGGLDWDEWPVHARNQFLRDTLAAVVVRRAGHTSIPVAERVRFLLDGYPIRFGGGNPEAGQGINPIPLPPADAPHTIRVEALEDALR